ncbi:MAG: TetR/AcrR family transcriptional regulator [Desulfobacula sp.]|nr:TetR/AcrR family transcriptional regulator [Desulfobacula sp.]
MKSGFTKKQRELVEAAMWLFSRHGVKRVSVKEICKKASTSKMTYYKYFSNKHEMVRTVLSVFFGELIEMFEKFDSENISFREKFDRMFALEIEKIKEMGQDFFEEISNPKGDLYKIYSDEMVRYLEWFAHYYRKAQERGDIRKNISIDSIIFIMGQLEDLMNKPEMVKMFPKYEDRIMELGNIFLYGIIEQN